MPGINSQAGSYNDGNTPPQKYKPIQTTKPPAPVGGSQNRLDISGRPAVAPLGRNPYGDNSYGGKGGGTPNRLDWGHSQSPYGGGADYQGGKGGGYPGLTGGNSDEQPRYSSRD